MATSRCHLCCKASLTRDLWRASGEPQTAFVFSLRSPVCRDLADIRKQGKLNRDEFAVAMHLINNKLAGRDVPSTLPTSLVPPSLRGLQPAAQEVTQGPSSATKDLFDLFSDDAAFEASPPSNNKPFAPAASAPAPAPAPPFLPQPPSRRSTSQSARQTPTPMPFQPSAPTSRSGESETCFADSR